MGRKHPLLPQFHESWEKVPLLWIDVETTGLEDDAQVVEIAMIRFEGGKFVDEESSLIDPRMKIPGDASAIHGITNDMVKGMPSLVDFLDRPGCQEIVKGAQPCAYNERFDKKFVPRLWGEDWPWLDCMLLLQYDDAFVKGKGRHKLEEACKRHKIAHESHRAAGDALAAGKLFNKLAEKYLKPEMTLGEVLKRFEVARANQWFKFFEWQARQPPLEEK